MNDPLIIFAITATMKITDWLYVTGGTWATMGEHIDITAVRLGRGKGNIPLPLYVFITERMMRQ